MISKKDRKAYKEMIRKDYGIPNYYLSDSEIDKCINDALLLKELVDKFSKRNK